MSGPVAADADRLDAHAVAGRARRRDHVDVERSAARLGEGDGEGFVDPVVPEHLEKRAADRLFLGDLKDVHGGAVDPPHCPAFVDKIAGP